MKKSIVFMFSGQGSQYYQMGRELYDSHPRFRLWMDHCDELARPLIDASLVDVLYRQREKTEAFDRVLYTNPALICIEYCLSRILMEMDIKPDCLLGYSLGEITSAIISGAISLADGIQLCVEYAKLLEEESPAAGMLAILESERIMDKYPDLFGNCWLTGKNFEKHFVAAGLAGDIQYLGQGLDRKDIVSQQLPVKYGFHTQLMQPLEKKFRDVVKSIQLSSMNVPIFSTLGREIVTGISEDHFWEVIRYPVDFQKTVKLILDKGDHVFIDVGPSGTLATFVKYLLPEGSTSLCFETINQFGKNLISLEKFKNNMTTIA